MSEAPLRRRAPGLGRGLSALLGDAQAGDGSASAVRDIQIAHIVRNPKQPRRHFDDAAMTELAESIASHGVMQPIMVRELPAGNYEIVAGERRWRAAQMAQLHSIPAIVRAADEGETLELALIENIQREQLNALEEGNAYRRLIDEFGHGQEALAKIVHKSRSHISNMMRLLELPESIQRLVAAGALTMGHARALLGVPDAERIAQDAANRNLSVRDVERIARAAKSPPRERKPAREANADIAMLERQLADLLGLKVTIAHDGDGGSVALHYATLDQLDMICQRLSGEKI